MAEDKMHFAPVMSLDPGDFVIIGDRVVEVDNTPRDNVDGALAAVEGTTFSHRADARERISARFSTSAMVPRLDDDFDLGPYTLDDGRVIEPDRWPDEPVIYVDLGQENRFTGSSGSRDTVEVSGFYVRHVHSDSSHTYVSLDGKSRLDQSVGDRIVKWRRATPAAFVAE